MPMSRRQFHTPTAATHSQQHLLAIAQRGALSEAVTDVLVGRCTLETARKVTDNKGASYGAHENYLMRRQTASATVIITT